MPSAERTPQNVPSPAPSLKGDLSGKPNLEVVRQPEFIPADPLTPRFIPDIENALLLVGIPKEEIAAAMLGLTQVVDLAMQEARAAQIREPFGFDG